MDINSIGSSFAARMGSLSKFSRLAIVVIIMIVALVVIQSSGLETKKQTCNLFPDCKLLPADISRIQIGLGQAGLNNFEIVKGEFYVPASHRADYLKVIGDSGLLPESLSETETPSANLNPFLSRTQQLLVQQSQKKKQICDMIRRLPFVSESWLEIDTAKSDSVFNPDQQSAVISIQPKSSDELNHKQISTIRQIVSGAFAGMEKANIVVTDLNAGIAYGGQNEIQSEQLAAKQVAWQKEVRTQQVDFENRIRIALSEYDGIEFDVHVVPAPLTTPKTVTTHRASFVEKPDAIETAHRPQAGTNGSASITNSQPALKARINTEKMLQPILQTSNDPNVSVAVRIPQDVVAKEFPRKRTSIFSSSESEDPQVLKSDFQKFKTQVINKIRPVLPASSFANSAAYPIAVSMIPSLTTAVAPVDQAKTWIAKHFPSVIVLLVGVTLLFLVIRGGESVVSPPSDTQLLSLHSVSEDEAAEQELLPEPEVTKQQLAELIDHDPDAAAKVIKSWIRNAA